MQNLHARLATEIYERSGNLYWQWFVTRVIQNTRKQSKERGKRVIRNTGRGRHTRKLINIGKSLERKEYGEIQ